MQGVSGLRSAQGSLVPASSDAVANAVVPEKGKSFVHSSYVPAVPATKHTVMMVSEMPAIPIISEDGKSEDLADDEKLKLIDQAKST